MNCADAENLICDYATLASAERFELERHLGECPPCAELARDSAAAVQFMARAADVEPPRELINSILFHSPWRRYKRGWLWKPFNAVLRPKFALSMALTILSLSMVMPKVLTTQPLQPRDLAPAQVWAGIEDRAFRMWARTQKFYDNLKFVYQIQTTLREWQQQSQEPSDTDSRQPAQRPQPGMQPPGRK